MDDNTGYYDRLGEMCAEYGLVAIRNDKAGKWDLAMRVSGWEYTRIGQVSDMDVHYTPWRLVEKRIAELILDRSFSGDD